MKKLSIFALAALVFAACTNPTPEPEAPDPVMTVDATEYEATNAADEFIFNIDANIDWYVTTEAEWLDIAPAEGNGASAVIVTIAANETYDAREGVITVAASDPEAAAVVGEKTITISQAEANALIVGESKYEVAAEATTIEIKISTNVEYTVECSADWLTQAEATRALEEKTIVINVAENTEYDNREGIVTIKSELGSDKVKVIQEQKRAVVLGETTFDVEAEASVIEVPLKRNTIFRTSTSVDWIERVRETRALEDDVAKFQIAANEAAEARTGYIYFETDESKDSVTVNQAGSLNAPVEISDARFAKFLRDNFDTNEDKALSIAELQAITEISFPKCPTSTYVWTTISAANLSGIEYMTNLETLDITGSKVTSLDLSNNTKLTSITAADTKLTALDVSMLPELTYLNVGASPIESLDLSNNTKLTYLCVSGCALKELNVSALTELTVLDCAYNNLTALDVAANTKLVGLYCNGNKLTELNVSALSSLARLNCEHNQLAALDVTANSNLTVLNCGRNKLSSLKATGLANLTILSAPYNMTLSSLDLTGLSKLRSLTLPHTGVTSISTAACPELVQVNLNESPYLETLDISASTKITTLVVDGTSLKTLDVSVQKNLGCLLAKDPQNENITTTPLESITLPDDMNLNKIPAAYIKFESTKWLGGFTPEAKLVDLSANGTANCYVVSQEGCDYKFKATVKGNGVATLSGDATAIAPTKARLLWAQNQTTTDPATIGYPQEYGASKAANLVIPESVTLGEDGYIYFKTGADMPNGNVGIVATDDDDNILWSWHLWVVNGYDPAATDIHVQTKGVDTYFMDRNIGAFVNYATVAAPDNNTHIASRGLYYQWGRKDPFIGHQSANGHATKALLYAADGSSSSLYSCYGGDAVFQGVAPEDAANSDDINAIMAWTAANPHRFIKGTGSNGYTWVATTKSIAAAEDAEWTKLWGNPALDESLYDKGGVKTMHDPCPVGYRVPSTGHYIFITSHGDQSSNGYGNNLRNWQFNSVEKIYDADGNPTGKTDTGWAKSAPFGLHFYANGVKTASPDAQSGVQDYGVLPADQSSVIYFPAQGWIPYGFGCSSNENELQYQTNRPAKGNVNCNRMMCSNDGNFYYGWTSVNWGQAMGLPVRCIRDNSTPVVPEKVDINFSGSTTDVQ